MDFENRIEYSGEQMMQSLEASLDRLRAFCYDARYRRTLGDAFVDKAAKWEQDIRLRKKDRFTVVVIGDFKRGKSTLINALLGEEVAVSDVTTETVTLNRISYGVHSNKAVLSGNRRLRLTDQELKRQELEKVFARLEEPVTRLELERPCELLERVTIIDTPGIGDAMKDFSSVVKESLVQADAVLYVYNVQYPLSRTEQMFLKAAVLPQRYTSLLLVGNYADTLGTRRQFDRMRELVKDRIHQMLPDAEIYMVSALDELCRQLGLDRPAAELAPVLEEQFAGLRAELEGLIAEKADTVVLDRMQRLGAAMVYELKEELEAVEKGLEIDANEAAETVKRISQEREERVQRQKELLQDVENAVESMKTEAIAWMGEFVERIIAETANLEHVSGDDLRKYYEFYCIDLLQEALNTCLEHHQDALYDRMDEISGELGEQLAVTFDAKRTYRFRINLDNRIWTKGDTVGFVTSQIGAANFLGGVASLAVDWVSGAMRSRESRERTPELRAQISGKLTGLNILVNETVETLYAEMGEQAKRLILDYYEGELERAEHLAEQTLEAARRETADKEALRAVVAEAHAVLDGISFM